MIRIGRLWRVYVMVRNIDFVGRYFSARPSCPILIYGRIALPAVHAESAGCLPIQRLDRLRPIVNWNRAIFCHDRASAISGSVFARLFRAID